MKKGIALILALCFLLSLSACGQLSSEELQATVPTMTVSAGGQQTAQATSGGGSWTYKGQSLVADAGPGHTLRKFRPVRIRRYGGFHAILRAAGPRHGDVLVR